jgi:hypothetical protein
VERKGKIIVSFRSCPAGTSIKQEGRGRTLNQRLFPHMVDRGKQGRTWGVGGVITWEETSVPVCRGIGIIIRQRMSSCSVQVTCDRACRAERERKKADREEKGEREAEKA